MGKMLRDKKEEEEGTMKSKWKNANNRDPRLVTSRTKAKVNFLLYLRFKVKTIIILLSFLLPRDQHF
jgi:hypothetical protein